MEVKPGTVSEDAIAALDQTVKQNMKKETEGEDAGPSPEEVANAAVD